MCSKRDYCLLAACVEEFTLTVCGLCMGWRIGALRLNERRFKVNSVYKGWTRAAVAVRVMAVALVLACLAPRGMEAGFYCVWGAARPGGKR